jgi:hypothetical protein
MNVEREQRVRNGKQEKGETEIGSQELRREHGIRSEIIWCRIVGTDGGVNVVVFN